MRIAVVGSYGVAMTMHLPRFPDDGETVMAHSFAALPGGKGSNQAIGAARQGADVRLLTVIGDDRYGSDARTLWAAEHVDAGAVLTHPGATMVGSVFVEPQGENRIVIAPGVLAEFTEELVLGFRDDIAAADVVIVSMEIPLSAVVCALRIAGEVGTTALLNPAPAVPLPDEAWAAVDVITPNRTEAPRLLGLPPDHGLSAAELVTRMRRRTKADIVLTLGAEGMLVSTGREIDHVAAFPPRTVVDTTGAGDSFTAALAVALADQLPLRSAVLRAAAAGAHTVAVNGVIDALPTRDQIQAVLAHQHLVVVAPPTARRPILQEDAFMAEALTDNAFRTLSRAELAGYIQHTRIEAGVTRDEMIAHAKEAVDHGFNAAMVPGSWVSLVAAELAGTGVEVASALDFPTVGVTTSAGKAFEAEQLVLAGATQLDVGVQIGWLKSGMYQAFRDDIAGVVRAAGVPVKVMLELPLLSEQEREIAIELSLEAGVAYLKNASSGQIETASPQSIRFLVARARNGVLVKASGSIRTYDQAVELLHAGAALLGTSAGLSILAREQGPHVTSY